MDQVQMIGGKQESELWHNTRMREQKLWQSTARAHLCSYSSKGNRNFITGFSGSLIRSLKAFEESLLTSDDCSLRCQWKRMHLLSVQKMAPCGTFFFFTTNEYYSTSFVTCVAEEKCSFVHEIRREFVTNADKRHSRLMQ